MNGSTKYLRSVILSILRHPKMSEDHPGQAICATGVAKKPAVGSNYSAFFRDFYPVVFRFLLKAGINTSFAEDATQEAFITAYNRWPDVGKYEAPNSWVCTVALRLARRYVRLQKLHIPLDRIADSSFQEDPFEAESVLSVLQSLPTRQRECIALLVDGFTPTEISEALSLSDSTVRSNIRHARRNIMEEPDKVSPMIPLRRRSLEKQA
jgi:RNA polymerase sigma factor (sigma-70 family)